MDTGSFNQFHDTRDEDLLTIADRIYFDFFTDKILIDEDRLIFVYFYGVL